FRDDSQSFSERESQPFIRFLSSLNRSRVISHASDCALQHSQIVAGAAQSDREVLRNLCLVGELITSGSEFISSGFNQSDQGLINDRSEALTGSNLGCDKCLRFLVIFQS